MKIYKNKKFKNNLKKFFNNKFFKIFKMNYKMNKKQLFKKKIKKLLKRNNKCQKVLKMKK